MASQPSVLCEDPSLFILEKPAGMPSVSLHAGEEGTLAAWLLKRHPEQAAIGAGPKEAGICHRLDNETSGLVIAARTQEAYEELRRQFSDGSARKEYLALVLGSPPEKGSIECPIAHHPRKRKKMVACESDARAAEWKGRPAHTEFSLLHRYELPPSPHAPYSTSYALLSVVISTGVRHQIRCHLAHLGFPIAGDRLYQNAAKRAEDRLPLARHFLHCHRLTIRHPSTREEISFTSPLPEELAAAIRSLTY
jgi:23S rRNA pseudouridine1911/1915/1917 synthase